MAEVRVTPSELRRFASQFRERAKIMGSKSKRLHEIVIDAGSVWRDEKYKSFRGQLEATSSDLDDLIRLSLRYADYLEEKARRAQRFLDGR